MATAIAAKMPVTVRKGSPAMPSPTRAITTVAPAKTTAEPAFRQVYAESSQRSKAAVGASIKAALATQNCALITSGTEATELLHAVYDYGAVALIEPAPDANSVETVLGRTLRALIRPQP